MNGTLAGLIGVETRVILRRRSLWIALIPAYLVVTLLAVTSPGLNTGDGAGRVADWATMFNMLLGLVFSATFVGALGVRGDDGLSQLQRSTPTAMWKQLLARVAGTLTVTLPVLAILLALGIYLGVTDGAWISVPAAVAVYLLLTLPAVNPSRGGALGGVLAGLQAEAAHGTDPSVFDEEVGGGGCSGGGGVVVEAVAGGGALGLHVELVARLATEGHGVGRERPHVTEVLGRDGHGGGRHLGQGRGVGARGLAGGGAASGEGHGGGEAEQEEKVSGSVHGGGPFRR